jgi:hypothetical protein
MRFRLVARRVFLAAALGLTLASAVTACSSSSSSASTSSAPSSSAPASSASASSGHSNAAAQIKANWEAFFQRHDLRAASAANTSREIGAVTGVAILGSLVVSQLRSSLTAQLHHLGIPAQFQALVINALETGQIPRNTSAYAGFGKIVQEVIGAAYTAFHDGLHVALYLSAGLMLGTGLLALVTLRSRPLTGEGK